jgi:hypothetical protein
MSKSKNLVELCKGDVLYSKRGKENKMIKEIHKDNIGKRLFEFEGFLLPQSSMFKFFENKNNKFVLM